MCVLCLWEEIGKKNQNKQNKIFFFSLRGRNSTQTVTGHIASCRLSIRSLTIGALVALSRFSFLSTIHSMSLSFSSYSVSLLSSPLDNVRIEM